MVRSRLELVLAMSFGAVVSAFLASGTSGPAPAFSKEPVATIPRDNPELATLYDEDQADRKPSGGKPIDWAVVGPRDNKRLARAKALYAGGELRTGKDFLRAAMVLQHANKADDHLLAHELCVAALAKGERKARWLAAAAEDRFLMNIGRPQRFGTQYRSSGPNDPVKLYEVGPGVTDGLRQEMDVPTLDESRKREAMMDAMAKGKKP